MANPDILFRGIPRGPTRGYTAQVIAAVRPNRVVIPCTGSFALAYVAREAGVQPRDIFCGDISLYTTALGHAIMGEDWSVRIAPEAPNKHGLLDIVAPYLEQDPIAKAAAILYTTRVFQYESWSDKPQSAFKRDLQQELLRNPAVYIDQLKAQVKGMADHLHGLTYMPQDMWLTLEAFKGDVGTIFLTNPPRYTGGYDRMFRGTDLIFQWEPPEAEQFTEKQYDQLMKLMGNDPSLTLMYYATQGEDPAGMWGEPWRSVFADRPGSSKRAAINWIVANRTHTNHIVSRTKIEEGEAKYPLFKGDIRPDSVIHAIRVQKHVGDYYRDLFIHKLPGSITEVYTAILIDGHLAGVVGVHLQNWRTGGNKLPANLTFAFTVPHDRYKLLHKLTLMSVCSKWYWQDVLGKEPFYDFNGTPNRLQTTMLTQHPENKTARGILKMTGREKQEDGTYKLNYHGDIHDRTREGTVQEWLQKFSDRTK